MINEASGQDQHAPPDPPKAAEPQLQDEVFDPEVEALIQEILDGNPWSTRARTIEALKFYGGI